MLPEVLSGDLCSLRPERDRLAVSVLAELDREGRLFGCRFAETVVRSRHRLHYGEVQEALDHPGTKEPALQHALETLQGLARALRRRRLAAGALELEVPEVKAWVDEHGVPWKIERRPHLESHELIEEFMLLANRCVGQEGARRRAGLLYRVHEPPSPAKLEVLDGMLGTLGLPRLATPGPGRHVLAFSDPAKPLQALLRAPLDPPRRRLLHRLVLRSLARARYLERDLGHFGLAAREYCHFTSPIRRYPDLHNHRRVREWIRGRPTRRLGPGRTRGPRGALQRHGAGRHGRRARGHPGEGPALHRGATRGPGFGYSHGPGASGILRRAGRHPRGRLRARVALPRRPVHARSDRGPHGGTPDAPPLLSRRRRPGHHRPGGRTGARVRPRAGRAAAARRPASGAARRGGRI